MTKEIPEAASASPLSDGLCVGDKVKLKTSIYDDGEDHHPPSWIGQIGEVLIVKEVRVEALAVAHEGSVGSFMIYPGEYETYNAEVTGRGPKETG